MYGHNKGRQIPGNACVAQLRNAGQEILCRLQPEPEKPFDSLAIAFRCEVDSSWHTIGYVVKEALDDVHETILAKKITAVSFDWVKFIIYWRTPGWYAGIKSIKDWRVVSDSCTFTKCKAIECMVYRYHSGVFRSPNIIADKDIIIELTVATVSC